MNTNDERTAFNDLDESLNKESRRSVGLYCYFYVGGYYKAVGHVLAQLWQGGFHNLGYNLHLSLNREF